MVVVLALFDIHLGQIKDAIYNFFLRLDSYCGISSIATSKGAAIQYLYTDSTPTSTTVPFPRISSMPGKLSVVFSATTAYFSLSEEVKCQALKDTAFADVFSLPPMPASWLVNGNRVFAA